MDTFQVNQLRIHCTVQTPIRLNEHKGSAIRGALFDALRGSPNPRATWSGFCANKIAASCTVCPVSAVCPVMRLVSTLDERGTHGQQAPRPYIINPPLDDGRTVYGPGEPLIFDVLLAGDAADLFPYMVLALDRLAYEGLGARLDNGSGMPRRGTARVTRIDAVHPLTGECGPVLRPNSRTVHVPALPVTHAQVLAAAARLPRAGDLRLYFITPLRLVEREQLVKIPYFRPLLHRLVERIKSLADNFGGGPVPFQIRELRDLADGVALVEDHTSWLDLHGYSTRLHREQVIGGLVGWATYRAADWAPFLPWLIWGALLHAGKNAVKGDGWFGLQMGDAAIGLPEAFFAAPRQDK
jgi:hypothetical protein